MAGFTRMVFILLRLAFIAASAGSIPCFPQEMPVPANMQAALFKKIFSYNQKLASSPEIKILVSFTSDSVRIKDTVVKAFQDAGLSVRTAEPEQIDGNLKDISAIYIIAGAGVARDACRKNKILSITGIPSLVQKGEAAVGLGTSDNKPKIFIHMEELKAEGHVFSSKLLQLAEVIQ